MGLFNKREKTSDSEIPALPKLPRLADFPEFEEKPITSISQLPSFPSNSFGKKFSRDSIKDAVSGERGDEDFYADEVSENEMRMKLEPLRKPMTEEMDEDSEMEIPERFEKMKKMEKMNSAFRQEVEPVFVRIDRFEEGLKIFSHIRNQITDIEGVLAETKKLKEREELELRSWENELKKIKEEIEKMGQDIFSKV